MNPRRVELLRRTWRDALAVAETRSSRYWQDAEQRAWDAFRDACDELNGGACNHVECPTGAPMNP